MTGRVTFENRQDVRDLSWLACAWQVADETEVFASGQVELPGIGPGASGTVSLADWPAADLREGREAWLTLRFTGREALAWAPAGFEVDAAQLALGSGPARAKAPAGAASTRVELDSAGRLVHPLLAVAPELCLWRAPTDNDRIGGMAARWAAWGLDRLVRRLTAIEREGTTTIVRTSHDAAPGITITLEQRLTPITGGGVRVDEQVAIPPALTDLARVGTVLETVPGLERIDWFGSGPHETYPDRQRGGLLGRWSWHGDRPGGPLRPARRRTAVMPQSAGSSSPTPAATACA